MNKKIILDLIHDGNKKRFSFKENSFTIGRSKNNDVHINDGHFSRIHLKVKRKGTTLFIADNNTTNGTFINGVKIPAGKYQEISSEDKIRFGNTLYSASFKVHKVIEKASEIKEEVQEQEENIIAKLQPLSTLKSSGQDEAEAEAEETKVHKIPEKNKDRDLSQELSLDDLSNHYEIVDEDDFIDETLCEKEFESELDEIDDGEHLEEDSGSLFTLDDEDLEEVYEEELEFAVDDISIDSVNEKDLLRDHDVDKVIPLVRESKDHSNISAEKSYTSNVDNAAFDYFKTVSFQKSSTVDTQPKIDKAVQLNNISQIQQVEVPEIKTDTDELLNQIESENELAEIHQLQFEQKKIEAQLVSLKLISDAEKKAEEILGNAKRFEDELYTNYEAEVKRIEKELESIHNNFEVEKESVDEQRNAIYKNYEMQKSQLNSELLDYEEKRRHVELEYGSMKELVEEANLKLNEQKEIYDTQESSFKEQQGELEQSLHSLTEQIENKKLDLETAKTEFEKKVEVFDNDIESKQKLVSILLEEKESLDKHIRELNAREEKKHKDYEALNLRIDELYKDRERLEESLSSYKGTLSEIESKIEYLNKESREISEQIEQKKMDAENTRTHLNEDLKSYKENIDNRKAHHDEELQMYKDSIQNKKTALNDEFNRIRKDKEFEIEEIERGHRESVEALKNEIYELEQELASGKISVSEEVKEFKKLLEEEAEQEAALLNEEIKDLRATTAKEYETFKKHREKEEDRLKVLESKTKEKCRNIEVSSIESKNRLLVEAKETAANLIEKSKADADQIISNAKSHESNVHEKAKSEAGAFVENARKRLDSANEQSERIINEAQTKALTMQETNLRDIKEKREGLQDEVGALKKEIEESLSKLDSLNEEYKELQDNMEAERQKIKEELEHQIKEKKVEAQEIYDTKVSEASKEADEIVSKAHAEYESSKISLTKKIEKERSEGYKKLEDEFNKLQNDFKSKLDQEKQMLAKLRATETENIKKMRKDAESELKDKKAAAINEIADSIERLVTYELKEAHDLDINSGTAQQTGAKIRTLVRENFSDGGVKGKGFFDKLNPYGSVGKGRSNIFWIKCAVGAGIALFFLITYLVFPSFYQGVSTSVSDAVKVDESAQKIYLDKIKEERSNRPVWNPTTDNKIRAPYSSNVLYVEDYAKTWLSDDFQADWTLKVDDIFINNLELSESKVVSFVSEEFKLIRDLQDIRDTIRLETEEIRIKEMKELEAERLQNIYEILEGKENYQKLHKFKKEFWKERKGLN